MASTSIYHLYSTPASYWTIISVTLLLLIMGSPTTADEYHYNNIITGDRAAGLGGAYTAIAEDPSGLFYNPAGIVHSVGSNISGSMNALHNVKTTYKKALGGKFDWERNSSVLFPNYFGVLQPFGKGIIGLSYAVTDSIQEDQDQTFTNVSPTVNSFTINFNNIDTTHNFGPSYAVALNDKLSVGITVYGHIRSQERITNQLTYLNGNTDAEWSNEYYYTEETGIRPIVGIMWSPAKKVSLGATLSKTIIFSSTTKVQASCRGAANYTYAANNLCQSSTLTRSTSESNHKRDHPIKLSLGAAYFYNEKLLVTGDFNYFTSTDDGRVAVFNFAFGGEYYLDSHWALRSGIFSNYANTQELQSTNVSRIQAEHVDMFGLGISLSHFSRNTILSLGLNYAFGDGKAQLSNADSNGNAQLHDVEIQSYTIFISATHSY